MKRRRKTVNEPRPVCPECGRVVDPRQARSFDANPRSTLAQVCEGVYCGSDCLLDAYERGYPKDRTRGRL